MRGIPYRKTGRFHERKTAWSAALLGIAMLGGGAAVLAGRLAPEIQSETRQAATARTVDFTRDIAPIFQTQCVTCHGAEIQQSGLRLDSEAAALEGSATEKVVVPGNSEASPLIRHLLGLEEPRMPFGGDPLSAEEIALIRAWIDQAAPAPAPVAAHPPSRTKHWAYIKPVRPEIPKVRDAQWVRNPIDNFVMARLAKEGLAPSPEAPRETLIRRLSLDLIGLPPSIEEVDAFVADQSPDAYEKVVDRLLASPHYGEKWARPWLDLGRYADSHGYEKDDLRTIWKYRDWVIEALNQDMSFREFTIKQIAGDMLPNPTTDQLIATGFHRNTLLNQEGGVDDEEARWETLVDRVNTTATVWLGTTLACAQCHNHKFDPFTQKDYYRFLAFFDNAQYKIANLGQGEGWVEEPELALPTPEQAARSEELNGEIARLQAELDTPTPALEAAQAQWEQEFKGTEAGWTPLRPSHFTSEGGATLTLLEDRSILAGGKNPEADTYTIEARTDLTGITGVRLEVLNDASLPHGGPGRDADGNFVLSVFEVEALPTDKSAAAQKVEFKDAVANDSQGGYGIKQLVKKSLWPTGWAVDVAAASAPLPRQAVFIPDKPFGFDGGTALTIRLKHAMRHAVRNIGRFRLSLATDAEPERITSVPARLRPVLDFPPAQRTEEQKSELAALYRSMTPLLKPTRDRIAELKKSLEGLGIVTTMVLRERASFERPVTHLRIRGSFLSPGERVTSAVPAVLPSLPEDQMPNRLGLAHWLVDDENPLTARVTVNHFWEQIFGRGLVETSEDFGTQGARPTHPELLDWLATEFMRQGWSMKALIRLIVTSATYRQSSRVTPELLERDAYNKLLARGPRFRVPAETVRDLTLAASGLLSPKIGGPSVFPYQPEGIWDRPYSDEKWELSKGEDTRRRGIYTFIRRTSPYPSLITFDAPSREFCTVRRVRTNTPLQALTTLNDPSHFEAAQALAKRLVKEAGLEASGRAAFGFRLCVARRPTAGEVGRIVAFYEQQLARFRQDADAARKVVGEEQSQASDAPELAAWTIVSNALLNLDETVTKE
ncbi:MAG: DUF1553 domain-containing protein [Acidobacteria bacterium]|nr:DUF1553 domain-containing protein [Acidobacteriota bacterium]